MSRLKFKNDEPPERLTEGSDFQEWSQKIDYALRHQTGLDKFTSERAHLHKVGYPFKVRQQKASYHAAGIMRWYISKTILSRIPKDAEKEPWEFWEILEPLSQPFPFFELPRELRDVIYDEYFLTWLQRHDRVRMMDPSYRYIHPRDRWWYCRHEVPGILRACKTARDETIPILYPQCEFYKDLGHDVGPNYWRRTFLSKEQFQVAETPLHLSLGDWKNTFFVYEGHLRHLRRLTVVFDLPQSIYRRDLEVNLSFEVDVKKAPQMLSVMVNVLIEGQCKTDLELRQWPKKKLKKHVEDCNALAEARGWRGEVIFHALESNPRLWMLGLKDFDAELIYVAPVDRYC